MGGLSPPFAKLTEISKGLSLEERRIAAIERRTAVLEKIEARKTTATQEKTQKQPTNGAAVTGDFATRRAEMDAILRAARAEIVAELIKLADEWQASTATQVCAAALRKFAATLQ